MLQSDCMLRIFFASLMLFAAERPKFSEVAGLPATPEKLQKLEEKFATSEAFVRGEIEKPEVMDQLVTYAKFAVELQKLKLQTKKYDEAQVSLSRWFQMAADLAYEEATPAG